MHDYTMLFAGGGSIKASQLVAEFERLNVQPPASLVELVATGNIRYSNQDFDVMSHAWAELRKIGDSARLLDRYFGS